MVALGCALTIPAAPQGLTLDYDAVDAVFEPPGGQAQRPTYGASCAGRAGWPYDGVQSPTPLHLCDAICNSLRTGGASGDIDVQLGCATQGGPGNIPPAAR